MEVPRLGIKFRLQLKQGWILNLLCWAGDWNHTSAVTQAAAETVLDPYLAVPQQELHVFLMCSWGKVSSMPSYSGILIISMPGIFCTLFNFQKSVLPPSLESSAFLHYTYSYAIEMTSWCVCGPHFTPLCKLGASPSLWQCWCSLHKQVIPYLFCKWSKAQRG